jgi:hypothetical protein
MKKTSLAPLKRQHNTGSDTQVLMKREMCFEQESEEDSMTP